MGKALILIVTASIMGAGLTLFTGVQQSTYKADAELSEHEARVVARQVALSAVSEARVRVLSNPDLITGITQFTGSSMGGTYQTTVTPVGEGADRQYIMRIDVRVPTGPDGAYATHTIELTYGLAPDSSILLGDNGVPQFFSYAILMEEALNVSGNMNVIGSPSLNADVHTNSSIFLEGGNSVGGFGSYVTTAESNPARRLMTTFQPAVNPDNLPTVRQVPRVNIVRFDASEYRDLATRTFSGNLNVTSTQTFGSRDRPEIWYIGGDLSIGSGARLDGYIIFLVQGDIVLTGNFETTGAVGNESNVGFYTSGSVRMSGNVAVSGQFLARRNLQFSGTSSLRGTVTVGGTVVWDGTPTVYYREASPALTAPLWPEPITGFDDWRPLSYREWAGRTEGAEEDEA
jgi:hypothetical protein